MKNKIRVVNWIPTILATLLGVFLLSATTMAGTTPAISSATFESDVASDEVVVFFNMPVWGDAAHSTALVAADFSVTDGNTDGVQTISSVVHTAGQDYAILVMNQDAVAGDTADTIAAVANSIFTVGGALSEKTVALTEDTAGPTVTSTLVIANGSTANLMLGFSEPIFTNAARGSVVAGDFDYTNVSTDGAGSISSITVSPDKRYVFITLNAVFAVTDGGVDTVSPSVSIFDAHGNASNGVDGAGSPQTLNASTGSPSISSVEAVIGSDAVLVTFNIPVFNADTCSGDLANTDFAYTDNNASGSAALGDVLGAGTAGTRYILLDLDANVALADLTDGAADEIVPASTAIYNCIGSSAAETGVDLDDTTDPVLLSVTKDYTGHNTVALVYSEPVQITGLTSASQTVTSTSTVGDMTTGCTIAGFGAFAAGNVIYGQNANYIANNSAQTQFTITLGGNGQYAGGQVDCTGTFTPTANVRDLHLSTNLVEATSIQSTIATSSSWILAGNASSGSSSQAVPTAILATVNSSNQVELTWVDPTNSDLKEINIYRGVSPSPVDGGNIYATVQPGVKTYTDTNLQAGDVVSYVIKAVNTTNNTSSASETVTITVEAGATTENPDTTPTTDPTTTEPTPPVDLTYDQEQQQVKDLGIVTTDFDKATNKCEAIVMLARAAGWEIDSTLTDDGFVDTPLWCKPYAAKAKELGVVNGRTATELGVDGEVNRYEIAMMLARVLGATEADMTAAAELTIYDDEIVDWAKGAVNWLHAEGVMTGYPDNTYKGANGILKIELAVALGRAFDLLVGAETAVTLAATLTGAAEMPAVVTQATGSCAITLEGTTATYTCTVEGLTVESAHFHMGVVGENGDVQHTIVFDGLTATGTWADLTAAQVTALTEGGVYINVHTTANASGEIRGQVL